MCEHFHSFISRFGLCKTFVDTEAIFQGSSIFEQNYQLKNIKMKAVNDMSNIKISNVVSVGLSA